MGAYREPVPLRRRLHDALCDGGEEQTDVHATHEAVVDRIIEAALPVDLPLYVTDDGVVQCYSPDCPEIQGACGPWTVAGAGRRTTLGQMLEHLADHVREEHRPGWAATDATGDAR